MTEALTTHTMMIVGSAPGYPHGAIDPIDGLGALAEKEGLWFHVDACHGFLTPFIKKLGYTVPDFDFTVKAVTTISVDLHKWGFAPKGISVILYQNPKYKNLQGFDFNNWPAGRYTSDTFTGTRTGGSVAAAWVVMNHLGEEGYLQIAQKVMETKQPLIDGIDAIDGLHLFSPVESGIITFGSRRFDIFAIADEMENRNWFTARTMEPPAMHLVVTPIHSHTTRGFLSDLSDVVDAARVGKLIGTKNKILSLVTTFPLREV